MCSAASFPINKNKIMMTSFLQSATHWNYYYLSFRTWKLEIVLMRQHKTKLKIKENELNVTKIRKANWMNGFLLHLSSNPSSCTMYKRWNGRSFKSHQWPKIQKLLFSNEFFITWSDSLLSIAFPIFPSHSLQLFDLANRAPFVCGMHCRSHRSFFIIIHQFFDWSGFGLRDSWAMTSFFCHNFFFFIFTFYCWCCCPICDVQYIIHIRSSSLLCSFGEKEIASASVTTTTTPKTGSRI